MTTADARDAPRDAPAEKVLTAGILAAPGVSYDLAVALARELPDTLSRRFPGVRWEVEAMLEPMAAASDQDVDLWRRWEARSARRSRTIARCAKRRTGTAPTPARRPTAPRGEPGAG